MSAYPPPPPAGGPYPPYDDRFARAQYRAQFRAQQQAQRQAIKAQYRAQRTAMRLQRRAMRRSSLVGPLLLLAAGAVLLLVSLGRLSLLQSLTWFGRWWPAVLIGAGVILLAEWALDQRSPETTTGVRTLGGGVVALLILIAFLGLACGAAVHTMAWRDAHLSQGMLDLSEALGNRMDAYNDLSSPIAPGAVLVVRDAHGDVTVTGDSSDGLVHVNAHLHANAWTERDNHAKVQRLQPVFSHEGSDLALTSALVEGGQADLTISVPAKTGVTVNADHGDISLSDLQGPVVVSQNHGDVQARHIAGGLRATVNDDDASLTLSDLSGSVDISGHTGDIEISEVGGALSLQGDFYGTTNLEHIHGATRFNTSRTQFSAARIDDEFSVEKDSLDATGLLGPVVLKTEDKNITLNRVQGSVEVTNRNGDVSLTTVAPLGAVSVENSHGSVDVGLPSGAAFLAEAKTRNGDMENDFGLSQQDNGDTHLLRGPVGNGSTKVTITTSDGDVTLRKSSAAPLTPLPPPAPTPPADPPAAPKASRSMKNPEAFSF